MLVDTDAQWTSNADHGTGYTVARESLTDGIDVFTDVSTAAFTCRMLMMTAVSSLLIVRSILASVIASARNLRVS